MAIKRGLGKGLGALIKDGATVASEQPREHGIRQVAIEAIRKSAWQPRRKFEKTALAELAESIREHGVLQPLLVRSAGDTFELIAGERRYTAATQAGLSQVPVIVMDVADRDALELALVENLQREDLNAIEEAEAYHTLAERFGLTQEQVATRVGKARASIANTVRLLSLPEEVRNMISDSVLSVGHAKVLTALDIPEEQILYARRAVKEDLTVRKLEALVRKVGHAPRKPRAARVDIPESHLVQLVDRLQRHLGTRVRIDSSRTFANGKKAKGAVAIDFYSGDDLDRILSVLGVMDD